MSTRSLIENVKIRYAIFWQDRKEETIKCSVVVSLGCGRNLAEPFNSGNIYNWKKPGDLFRDALGVVGILKVLADQVRARTIDTDLF